MGKNTEVSNLLDSSVNGTDDAVACEKFWVAALTGMNAEKKTAQNLSKEGIETFVACQREKHQWSDRIKIIERNVIPMVIFLYVSEDELKVIQKSKLTRKILGFPGSASNPVHIPTSQIEKLKFMLENAENPIELDNENLKLGEEVIVTKGPLKGLKGTFLQDMKGAYLSILIDSLGAAKTMIEKKYVKRC